MAKERWLAARRAEWLPIPYFHIVFTLPHALNALAQGNPRIIYDLLCRAVTETLLTFGRDPRPPPNSIGALCATKERCTSRPSSRPWRIHRARHGPLTRHDQRPSPVVRPCRPTTPMGRLHRRLPATVVNAPASAVHPASRPRRERP